MTDERNPSDATTGAGNPSDNTTLMVVLEEFRQEGWEGNLVLSEDGPIRCSSCREESAAEIWEQGPLRRMEGASDPDDMLSVLGLVCPQCGSRGILILHYGPTASPAEASALLAIGAETGPDDKG